MAEYVNLDDMLEQFDKRASKLVGDRRISVESMREFIGNRPKANVKEIVYAHWIEEKEHLYLANGICKEWMNFYCSKCDTPSPAPTQYCPHCGAEMSEVE